MMDIIKESGFVPKGNGYSKKVYSSLIDLGEG